MKKTNDPRQHGRLNVLSDRECRRLAKRAASMAIAAALASSVLCAPALAVNYDASAGTVFVEGSDGVIQSWQGENPDNISPDTDINITGGTQNSDGVDTTDQILHVSGNVDKADIDITDVTAELTGDKNAIEIEDGASNVDINMDNVDIKTEGGSAVHVGEGTSNVDVSISHSKLESKDADAIHIEGNTQATNPEDGVTLNLNDVNITTDGQNINSIYVGDDTVGQLTLSAVQMEVNGTGGNGIEVGAGSNVDIALNESTEDAKALDVSDTTGVDITLNANQTSGIAVMNGKDAETHTQVDITVSGTTTIASGEASEGSDARNKLEEIDQEKKQSVNMAGIVVGGEAADSYSTKNSDSNRSYEGSAQVTITSAEEAETANLVIGEEGRGLSTGILIRDNDSMVIDGNGTTENDWETNPDEEAQLNIAINDTLKTQSTIAGNGIVNAGDLTIQDGANLTVSGITDSESKYTTYTSANSGIVTHASDGTVTNLLIRDGATVNVENVTGKNGAAGIYLDSYNSLTGENQISKLQVENAKIQISNVTHGYQAFGINSNSVNVTITDGSEVNISGINNGYGMTIQKISGNGDTLRIEDGADVTIEAGISGIYQQGSLTNDAEQNRANKVYVVVNGADLTIKNGAVGIDSCNGDITFENQAKVVMSGVNNGINMSYGSTPAENLLIVKDDKTDVQINAQKIGINLSASKTAQIYDGAAITVTGELATAGVRLGGGLYTSGDVEKAINGSTMIVENATLDVGDSSIVLGNTADGESTVTPDEKYDYDYPTGHNQVVADNVNLLEIRNGAKVVAGSVTSDGVTVDGQVGVLLDVEKKSQGKVIAKWTVTAPGKKGKLVITGGTLDLTSDTAKGLNKKHLTTLPADARQNAYENETIKEFNQFVIWPSNGEDYGSENLVNFQLTVSELQTLFDRIKEQDPNFSMEGDVFWFNTAGFKFQKTDNGQYVPTYIDYDASEHDWLGDRSSAAYEANGYMCDLSKYGENEKLSVWVPAVLLEYYYGDSVDDDIKNMTEDELRALIESGELELQIRENQIRQDVVIRGQSINFATLNDKYTSGILGESDKVWYFYGPDGKAVEFNANTNLTPEVLKTFIEGKETVVTPNLDTMLPVKKTYGIAALTDGGGGATPTPIPNPDPDPEDELELVLTPVPTEEEIPETETPLTDAPVEEIPEKETPLADAPVVDESLEEIGEENVPLADVPTTGDESGVFGLMAALSGMALAVMSFIDRKGRHARFGSQH